MDAKPTQTLSPLPSQGGSTRRGDFFYRFRCSCSPEGDTAITNSGRTICLALSVPRSIEGTRGALDIGQLATRSLSHPSAGQKGP